MLHDPIALVVQTSMPFARRLVCKLFEKIVTLFFPRTLRRATKTTSKKTKQNTSSTNNLLAKK